MSKYFRVSPKFWSDPEVLAWSDDGRLLALYFLTCPHRTTEGLFRLPKEYAQSDLNWTRERFGKGLAELLETGFLHYDEQTQIVLIPNALKYQAPENENQAKAAWARIEDLPSSPLTSMFKGLAERYALRLAELFPEGYGEGYGNPLALTQALAPSLKTASGEEKEEEKTPNPKPVDDEDFRTFWEIYPKRDGKRLGKANTARQFSRLTQQARADILVAAKHYRDACAGGLTKAKDPERFVRDDVWGDWMEPATPDPERSSNGKRPADDKPAPYSDWEPPDEPKVSEEERQRNLERLRSMMGSIG